MACGTNSESLEDAPAPSFGSVTAHVFTSPGQPLSARTVVFSNPNGSIAAVVETDNEGIARADVSEGSSLTLALPNPAGPNLMNTVLGLKPGDEIELVIFGTDYVTANGTFTVDFTEYKPNVLYMVSGPCTANSGVPPSITIDIKTSCPVTTLDVTLQAFQADETDRPYVRMTGIPYVAGGRATMPSTWTPSLAVTGTYSNAPTGVTSISAARRWNEAAAIGSITEGHTTGAASTFTSTFTIPPTELADMRVSWESGPRNRQTISEIVDGTMASYEIDLAAEALPSVGTPTFDPSTATFTMEDVGDVDLTAVKILFADDRSSHDWFVFGPALTSFTLPEIPSTFPRPTADHQAIVGEAKVFEATNISGYDDARQHLTLTMTSATGELPALGTRRRVSSFP
jgi:hypothetical protein